MKTTGGKAVVDALMARGVKTIFGVPGESYLDILDALYDVADEITFISCRHEGGAAFMAEAYGKLTGEPGVALVTRGPGACNASIGVHTAFQDSTPMVLMVGQVPGRWRGREAFQEVDYGQMFGPLAKWATEATTTADVAPLVNDAFDAAMAGRRGPAVLALPEDVLVGMCEATTPHEECPAPLAGDLGGSLRELERLLRSAEQPLLIVGGGGWSVASAAALGAFVEDTGVPTVTAFRCQDLIDNRSAYYAGDAGININPALRERIRDADVVFAIGCRLGEMTTQGYTLFDGARPDQRLVHVYPDAGEFGRVYPPALAIHADVATFVGRASGYVKVDSGRWAGWAGACRADFEKWVQDGSCAGNLDMGEIVRTTRRVLDDDAILTSDAGNFSAWFNRYFEFRAFRTLLGPTNGAMGYGVPAAVAAKAADRRRQAVAVVGDGGILMTGQEIATAVQYDLDPVVLIVDNGMYGTIRMHQEKSYPGRVIGTDLVNPDFVAWARSLGAAAEAVGATADYEAALRRALAAGRPAVIVLRLDPEALTTSATLSEIRERALAG